MTAPLREEALAAARALEAWGRARDWRGSDPYDGLNAARFGGAVQRTVLGRRALTQVVKRSPLDLRPLLAIPAAVTPAALAHVASAYACNGFLAEEVAEERLRTTLAALDALRSPGFEEPCWGYHFDVQTRVFFYARNVANTIATSFAGFALLDAWEATGDAELLEHAEAVAGFFLDRVPQTGGREGAFFGYLAGDRTPIHNASLLVCALLARLHAATGRSDYHERAEAGVRYALAHQRANGSWPYGERPGLEWIDGFHTGYVLESLVRCAGAGVDVDSRALARGLDFYERELFLGDGTPRYFVTSTYPIDIQSAAQGIQTFVLAERLDAAARVLAWTLRHLRRPDGAFAFQRRRFWTNATPHIRWGQAPMFEALARFVRASGGA
ncbi:MAG: hypothetical protein ACYDCH_01685 [Gaiellaceae bacterium]